MDENIEGKLWCLFSSQEATGGEFLNVTFNICQGSMLTNVSLEG